MAKKKNSSKRKVSKGKQKLPVERDSTYFLKITIFLILGSQWVYVAHYPSWEIPIPVGLIIGLVFATHEHFQIDRKIEYLVLLIVSFVAFWLPMGIVLNV